MFKLYQFKIFILLGIFDLKSDFGRFDLLVLQPALFPTLNKPVHSDQGSQWLSAPLLAVKFSNITMKIVVLLICNSIELTMFLQ